MTAELVTDRMSLFLDVDGTLIDIATRPNDVVVPPALVKALRLANRLFGGALALVSGRTIADLDALFFPLRLRASGVHGAEVRFDPDGAATGQGSAALSPGLIEAIHAIAARFEGTIFENKHYSAAVHYRLAPHAGPTIRALLERLLAENPGRELRLLPGHMVFEIKSATFDKGVAINRFLEHQPFQGRIPVFLGDDVTDKPGFDTVLAHGGYAYSVGTTFPGLSGSFPDPASVRHWLAGLAPSEASHA